MGGAMTYWIQQIILTNLKEDANVNLSPTTPSLHPDKVFPLIFV